MFCPFVTFIVMTPMTWPFMLKSGLPELPCEMGAVIWMISPRLGTSRTAETMPSETEPSRRSGLPMTKTCSPSSGSESATSRERARSLRDFDAQDGEVRLVVEPEHAGDGVGLALAVERADLGAARALYDV